MSVATDSVVLMLAQWVRIPLATTSTGRPCLLPLCPRYHIYIYGYRSCSRLQIAIAAGVPACLSYTVAEWNRTFSCLGRDRSIIGNNKKLSSMAHHRCPTRVRGSKLPPRARIIGTVQTGRFPSSCYLRSRP